MVCTIECCDSAPNVAPVTPRGSSIPGDVWYCLSPEGPGGGDGAAGAPPCGGTRRQRMLMPNAPRGEGGIRTPDGCERYFHLPEESLT